MKSTVLQVFSASSGTGILGDGSTVSLPFGIDVESTLLLELLAVAAGVGFWFVLYAVVLSVTRPADVDPLPPSADIPGAEPPAIVSLLAGRWKLNEDAAESTLIDLAARRWIEFRQPGNDPTNTTVHLLQQPGGRPVKDQQPLTSYEEMVLARVRTEAVDHVVPITALTFRDLGTASTWTARLHRAVIEDARARGLTRRRFSPLLVTLLSGFAAVPAVLLALVIMERSGEVGAGPGAGLIGWGLLSGLAGRPLGERDTPAGRELAARWLGLKAFLRNDEAFAELPPSAVAVWDRYLSYGDALGVTRVCSALIDLGMGDRKRVWSSFGGTWHRVRVRYPKFWGRYGATVPRVLAGAAGVLVVGVLILKAFGEQGFDRPDSLNNALVDLPLVLGLYLVARGIYRLGRLAADLIAPRVLAGEVLWVELWKSTTERENHPARPLVHYFAVDDGTGERTTAWALPSDWYGRAQPGDLVTITVRPWTRRVSQLVVDVSRAARLTEAASVPVHAHAGAPAAATSGAASASGAMVATRVGQGTAEPLGSAIPGLGGIVGAAGGTGEGALSPVLASAAVACAVASAKGDGAPGVPQLLDVNDVSAALGLPVVSDGSGARMQLGPFELVTFSQQRQQQQPQAGPPVLVVAVARGAAVGLVMRGVRRNGTVLPGVGDEAWCGAGWVLGRAGDTLVRLNLEPGTAGAGAGEQALPNLLARALSRV